MRTFTALFDTREEALAVQSQLTDFGVFDADRVGLHDKDNPASPWTSAHNAVPPEEDRRLYEESVRRGGFLLTVNVDDEYADRVHDVLENSAAVDVDERERHYREAGYMAAPVPTPAIEEEPSAPAEIAPQPAPVRAAVADDSIPVVEEQLRVGKRETERGAVRLRSYVVEQAVHEQVALREEHVEIERSPSPTPTSCCRSARSSSLSAPRRPSSRRKLSSARRSRCGRRSRSGPRRSRTPCAAPRWTSRAQRPRRGPEAGPGLALRS